MLFSWSEKTEIFGGGAEDDGLLFCFIDLFVEFSFRSSIPIVAGLGRELSGTWW